MTITEEQFREYLSVQEDGLYNVFDPKAREMTSLVIIQVLNLHTNLHKTQKNARGVMPERFNYIPQTVVLFMN